MLFGGNPGGSGGALDHQVGDCLVHRDDLHLEPKVVQAYQDQDPWEHHCEDQQVVVHQQEAKPGGGSMATACGGPSGFAGMLPLEFHKNTQVH